ncbi:MAG: ATPase, T2SS/T4P/T4SS family [Planctomycetota bacterium]
MSTTPPENPKPAQNPANTGQGATPTAPRPAGAAPVPGAPRPAGAAPVPGAPRPAGAAPLPGAPRPAGAAPAAPVAPRPAGAAPAAPGAPRPAGAAPAVPGAPRPAGAAPAAPGAPRPAGPTPVSGAAPGAPKPAGAAPAAPKPAAPAPKPAAPIAVKKPVEAKPKPSGGRPKIGEILVGLGLIDEQQLFEMLDEARSSGKKLGTVAVSRGLVNEDQLVKALAEQSNIKIGNLNEQKSQPEALLLVSETMASMYKVIPLTFKDKILSVAIVDPNNLTSVDDLRNLLGLNEVIPYLVTPTAFEEAQKKSYAGKEDSIADLIQELEADGTKGRRKNETSIDLESLMEQADSAPVRRLINMVFLMAIRDQASDIHFEPFEEDYKMRYKCDGVLFELPPPPKYLANAIASRIKVMANLDIAERRLPQDGRIELTIGGNRVDMRVSTLPTLFGESAVIRLLDKSVVALDINKLGIDATVLATFRELINKPNGVVLVTGPTGSGKTTTLYSALNELNVIEEKIITTEDPVEYEIEGLVQCPINHEVGMTFAAALRSILRQDPDKILVGEIRDLETAQIAVQAALTGHIVFSTLHTNDAPSTITRMRDMGLQSYLINACVEGVLAQRLVRKICINCREEFQPGPDQLLELNLTPEMVAGKKFFYGKGCDTCNNTGYKGRMGIHELLVMTDELRDLISKEASTDELRDLCVKSGMKTLRWSGVNAIHQGLTTMEEIIRETVTEE